MSGAKMVGDVDAPELPIPVFRISSSVERYMLYDVNTVTWLRKTHHILGVLIGTLPHVPQQNVFLGLPLEIMPEEAKMLVDKGVAYIVADSEWQYDAIKTSTAELRKQYVDGLVQEGTQTTEAMTQNKVENMERAMRQVRISSPKPKPEVVESSTDLFETEETDQASQSTNSHLLAGQKTHTVTPTTATRLLGRPLPDAGGIVPVVDPSSYAVFEKLHENGYYMSPGLRFGCQYMAYPGDPLRFHSHFLVVGADWDEEIDLIDLVGGGRLGTGVKKGFMIGGVQPQRNDSPSKTRTFCLEWGGM